MIRFIAVLVGAFIAISAHAQPDLLWSQTYGGEDYEYCHSVIQTPDGGFALAGETQSFGDQWGDFWLVRTDEEGEELWSQTYGGEQTDRCYSVIQTPNGSFALAGLTNSFGEGGYDFWLVVADEEGEETWSQTYGGGVNDYCYSVIQTADGGFALAGVTWSFGEGGGDFWLVVTDEEGEELWSQTYGGRVGDVCSSIIQTSDGGFALAGTTTSFGEGDIDFWLVRTDDEGEELWTQTYGGRNADWCYSLIQTADCGFALAGFTRSFGDGENDFWLVKIDEEGEEIWSQTYGGESDDWCYSHILTPDNGFSLAGTTSSFGEGSSDFWLVRTDEEGEELWSQTYGGEDWDGCKSFIQTADGGFALAGFTTSFGEGELDFWLIRTGPDPDLDRLLWLALPETGFVEDASLQLSLEYLYEHIFSPDFPDSTLIITVEDGEYIYGEIDDEGLTITANPDWHGLDSLILIVTNPDENSDTTYQRIAVLPLNDLPEPFALISPPDEAVIGSWEATFRWEWALQNEWELDTVRYTLSFRSLNPGWESEYSLEGLTLNRYVDLEMDTLTDWLELDLGEFEYRIEWWVSAVDDSGFTECDERFTFIIPVEGVHPWDEESVPDDYILTQNYPNPFNATTQVRFGLPKQSAVRITVLDLYGRTVAILAEHTYEAGFHSVTWDATAFPTGIYLVQLEAGEVARTVKMTLIR